MKSAAAHSERLRRTPIHFNLVFLSLANNSSFSIMIDTFL
jgi:hypothetical protein